MPVDAGVLEEELAVAIEHALLQPAAHEHEGDEDAERVEVGVVAPALRGRATDAVRQENARAMGRSRCAIPRVSPCHAPLKNGQPADRTTALASSKERRAKSAKMSRRRR